MHILVVCGHTIFGGSSCTVGKHTNRSITYLIFSITASLETIECTNF